MNISSKDHAQFSDDFQETFDFYIRIYMDFLRLAGRCDIYDLQATQDYTPHIDHRLTITEESLKRNCPQDLTIGGLDASKINAHLTDLHARSTKHIFGVYGHVEVPWQELIWARITSDRVAAYPDGDVHLEINFGIPSIVVICQQEISLTLVIEEVVITDPSEYNTFL
jgi:hypothetical protein